MEDSRELVEDSFELMSGLAIRSTVQNSKYLERRISRINGIDFGIR